MPMAMCGMARGDLYRTTINGFSLGGRICHPTFPIRPAGGIVFFCASSSVRDLWAWPAPVGIDCQGTTARQYVGWVAGWVGRRWCEDHYSYCMLQTAIGTSGLRNPPPRKSHVLIPNSTQSYTNSLPASCPCTTFHCSSRPRATFHTRSLSLARPRIRPCAFCCHLRPLHHRCRHTRSPVCLACCAALHHSVVVASLLEGFACAPLPCLYRSRIGATICPVVTFV